MTDALAIQLILSVTSLLTSAVTATAVIVTSRKTRNEIRDQAHQTIEAINRWNTRSSGAAPAIRPPAQLERHD